MCRYVQKYHLSHHPSPLVSGGGQVPKLFFAMNSMKYVDLHKVMKCVYMLREIIFLTPAHWVGLGIQYHVSFGNLSTYVSQSSYLYVCVINLKVKFMLESPILIRSYVI